MDDKLTSLIYKYSELSVQRLDSFYIYSNNFHIFAIILDDCYDRSTDCIRWAFEGRCISQAQQMKDRCPLSCEYCRPALCVNIDANCYRWAETQACHIFPKLMAKKCRLACGYCSYNGLTVHITQP